MARLRFKIELNPGGKGVRLDKLARISGELERFVRSLAADCGADLKLGEWVAKDYYDSSFGALIEHVGTVPPAVAAEFNSGLKFLTRFDKRQAGRIDRFSLETIDRFVGIGEVIESDERINIGLLDDEEDGSVSAPEWVHIARSTTRLLQEVAHQLETWDGAIQGTLGTWYKESNYFQLKEMTHGGNVRCMYSSSRYGEVYALFSAKDAVVIVEGSIKSDAATGRAREIRAERFQVNKPLTDDEFERVLAGSPGQSGSASTAEFIERRRASDET